MAVETIQLWCEHALLPGGPAERVTIDVTDGRITAVAADTERPSDSRRRRGVTIPGAANTHGHVFHRALRHRSQMGHGSFWTWREQMYAVAEQLDPDRYHRLARAVFSEMVLSGFTTAGEFHYVHHQPDGTPYSDPNAIAEAITEAAVEAGIRITLLDTVYLHGGLADDGYLALYGRQRRFGDADVDAWMQRVDAMATTPRRLVGAAVHSVRAVDPASLLEVASWAGRRGAPLHAHVSEQTAENDQCLAAHGCTPIQLLDRGGALGPLFTAVHATHITSRDLTLLRKSGSAVCLCPTTERDLGDGVGPARRLADSGVTLAIGSDSHAVIDPFEEMRAVELDERLVRGERGVFTTAELLATATAGHRLLGWTDVGEIAVGQRADLVSVALDSVRTAGGMPGAVAEAVVFGAAPSDVTHVMIDGVDVVKNGQHRHVDVAAELTAAIDEIIREADS